MSKRKNKESALEGEGILLQKDFFDLLVENIDEPVEEEPAYSEQQFVVIEKVTKVELKRWNIVECPHCNKNFDMLTCSYRSNGLVCPHCKKLCD